MNDTDPQKSPTPTSDSSDPNDPGYYNPIKNPLTHKDDFPEPTGKPPDPHGEFGPDSNDPDDKNESTK